MKNEKENIIKKDTPKKEYTPEEKKKSRDKLLATIQKQKENGIIETFKILLQRIDSPYSKINSLEQEPLKPLHPACSPRI